MIKNAFITGAASGIGRATAEALYEQGWSLGLADVNEGAIHEYTIEWDPERVRCYALDVRSAQQFADTVSDFAKAHQNNLRLLFNCAGILTIDKFENISPERHQQIVDINVTGVINGCLAGFPYLRHTSGALVINMSSASAVYGTPDFASYSASKFAVSALTEALDIEWAEYGIRVCDIMPPFVKTAMVASQQATSPFIEKMGVNLYPEDIAAVVLKQIEKPKTHRAVSFIFQVGWALAQVLPRSLLHRIFRMLAAK